MSRPSAGNYIIYNRVLSPTGEKLAITFHGENQFVTVEPVTSDNNQVVRNPSPYSAYVYPVVIRIDHYAYL